MQNKESTFSERLGRITGPLVGGTVGASVGKGLSGSDEAIAAGAVSGAALPALIGIILGRRTKAPNPVEMAERDIADSKIVKDLLIPGYAYREAGYRSRSLDDIDIDKYEKLVDRMEDRKEVSGDIPQGVPQQSRIKPQVYR